MLLGEVLPATSAMVRLPQNQPLVRDMETPKSSENEIGASGRTKKNGNRPKDDCRSPHFIRCYLSSTTKTSPRQSVPDVQVLDPDSEPRVPIQSEEKANHLPSCETLPIAYWVLKFWFWVVMKL